LELSLGRALAVHRAAAPLTVREEAGGHTEWYRGAGAQLLAAAGSLRTLGHRVHAPLRPRLREMLDLHSQRLFGWTQAVLEAEVLGLPSPISQSVRDALDACVALGIPVQP